ncbi:type VII secretion system-associated protein [Micromonospora sp. C28ISP2-4]|uniref:type VII secretion system-associated protein n=1 Tax=Micromonospora sp. C28ISP2-4 TaxID=3059523 RepID=UPI0026758D58|nr:type VII secretion system-associated protein [Micromonospora sp. C28ISP2-4]MDO3686626.1 type VII secretion system-associated protein [Micromonospora sp. C28ISP2-4]
MTHSAEPLDVLLRRMMRGDATIEQVQSALRGSRLDLAMNGDGRPLVVRSFDDSRCVVVATSADERARTFAPQWRRVEAAELAELLPDGIDVLVDPGGPEPVRLAAAILWHALQDADEDAGG